jgi:hypothetical protein
MAVGVIAGWGCWVNLAWADGVPAEAADATSTAVTSDVAQVVTGDLSQKTDTELTELTAQWSKLSPSERRELLAEVTGRMAANRNARANVHDNVGVRVQRRYGRVVRKRDGSVVVETRVVEVRPRANRPDGLQSATVSAQRGAVMVPRGRVTFGIGFEQRSKSRQAPDSRAVQDSDKTPQVQQSSSAPAVTVSQPPAADETP